MTMFDDTMMMILDDDAFACPTNNNNFHVTAQHEEEALYGDVDIIMQLDADEGLLPDLNDDCLESDNIIFSSQSLENDILCSLKASPDVVSVDDNNSCNDSDSFLSSSAQQEDELNTSCHSASSSLSSSSSSAGTASASLPPASYFSSPSDKAQFQGMLAHLSAAMQRTRHSRHSLLYFGPYPLSQHGQAVMSHVEYSSQQVDSYSRALRM